MLKWHLLDWFFVLFHSVVILFNLFGWIFRGTRKWNLALLLLTAASWFGLGVFYGWGYCFLTDWHWQVLEALSVSPHESSYVQYLFRRVAGVTVGAAFADVLTAILFFAAMAASLFVNIRDRFRIRSSITGNL
jgi:hypothetical protein